MEKLTFQLESNKTTFVHIPHKRILTDLTEATFFPFQIQIQFLDGCYVLFLHYRQLWTLRFYWCIIEVVLKFSISRAYSGVIQPHYDPAVFGCSTETSVLVHDTQLALQLRMAVAKKCIQLTWKSTNQPTSAHWLAETLSVIRIKRLRMYNLNRTELRKSGEPSWPSAECDNWLFHKVLYCNVFLWKYIYVIL